MKLWKSSQAHFNEMTLLCKKHAKHEMNQSCKAKWKISSGSHNKNIVEVILCIS